MRIKSVLSDIDDISILLKYLYLDPAHKVRFNNGITDLELRMTDNLDILCKNLSFPDLPETNFSDMMTPSNTVGIIDILKSTSPCEYPDSFKNRWEEIRTICLTNCALNQLRRGDRDND